MRPRQSGRVSGSHDGPEVMQQAQVGGHDENRAMA